MSKPTIYEPKSKNMPTVGFLIFNRHETDKRKARRAFIERFGRDRYNEIIKPIERAGVMSIFHNSPNPYTAFYVNVMAESVDRRAMKRELKRGTKGPRVMSALRTLRRNINERQTGQRGRSFRKAALQGTGKHKRRRRARRRTLIAKEARRRNR